METSSTTTSGAGQPRHHVDRRDPGTPRREHREELLAMVDLGVRMPAFLQKKPYTAVKLELVYRGITWYGLGFTKVRYPDKWDAQHGHDLARAKARADIVRQIMEYEDEEVSE